ncbi:hypothetical protein Pcinc_010070 [Petrolisthes cinctipes]|uniref:Carbohydrate sulfotransferase n=1 Tax=Petrolisthes cinctipes TaxID=88211 RepID=A0AAE1G3S5_PETCI|nr:hypothetical protein Pcinc_010070 [Petrolisthes cinctipes]
MHHETIRAFMAKLDLWKCRIQQGNTANFRNLDFVLAHSNLDSELKKQIITYLSDLKAEFIRYFPDIDDKREAWKFIRNPFHCEVADVADEVQEEFLELKFNSTAKEDFQYLDLEMFGAGSSTWIQHLNNMAGFYPQGNVHTKNWMSNVRARKVLGLKEAASRLNSSVNVMIARHPLARFVSAFRDKFADGRRLDKPQSHGHYSLFWKPALRSLNRNISGPLQINFTEFTTFAMKTRKQDPHWKPLTNMCSSCDISYEYILFLETFNEDLQFLVDTLNITKINLETRKNYKNNGTVPRPREGVGPSDDLLTLDPNLLQYYLQLPPHLMAQVIHYYALDLKLLGFQFPPVLTSITTS